MLLALGDAPDAPSLSELARALALPKSTTHRLLGQLSRRGFVQADETGSYRLGPALQRLAHASLAGDPLVSAARPLVDEESRALGETLFVVAACGGELVVLHKHEGTGFLRAAPELGSTVPIHATAAGRLYLAFAPDRIARTRGPMRAYTERTPTDRETLAARVALARERGYDENVGEWVDGLAVVSAAIRASDGSLHGVLACALAEARYLALGENVLGLRLSRTAERIAARIEGRKS